MLASPCLSIHSVLVAKIDNKSMSLPIDLACENQNGRKIIGGTALLDCGAGGIFMDHNFARTRGFPLQKLDQRSLC